MGRALFVSNEVTMSTPSLTRANCLKMKFLKPYLKDSDPLGPSINRYAIFVLTVSVGMLIFGLVYGPEGAEEAEEADVPEIADSQLESVFAPAAGSSFGSGDAKPQKRFSLRRRMKELTK